MRALRRLNAWINGVSLRELDSRIHVVNITEDAPDQELTWATAQGRSGQRLLSRTRSSKRISIEFDIRELYDIAARAGIVDAVNRWARDGLLTVSYRPEQRLRVLLTKAAEFGAARNITDSYTVEVTAATEPYWEYVAPVELQLTGTSGEGVIVLPGSAMAAPVIDITPGNASLQTLELVVAGQTLEFADLGVAKGKTLRIAHDSAGLLSVATSTASKLSKRTPESADDIMVSPGAVSIQYTANTSCTVAVSIRGRVL